MYISFIQKPETGVKKRFSSFSSDDYGSIDEDEMNFKSAIRNQEDKQYVSWVSKNFGKWDLS